MAEPDIIEYPIQGKDGQWTFRKMKVMMDPSKKYDPKYVDQVAQDYIKNYPTTESDPNFTQPSYNKGSLKGTSGDITKFKETHPVLDVASKTVGYPFQQILDRQVNVGENQDRPGWARALTGVEDTAANAMDMLAIPAVARTGLQMLNPFGKPARALAGYSAGSYGVERGLDAVGVAPEISRGAGMVAGLGTGTIAAGESPRINNAVSSGFNAAEQVPINRSSAAGVIGGTAGILAARALGIPWYAGLGFGAGVGIKGPAFISGASRATGPWLSDSITGAFGNETTPTSIQNALGIAVGERPPAVAPLSDASRSNNAWQDYFRQSEAVPTNQGPRNYPSYPYEAEFVDPAERGNLIGNNSPVINPQQMRQLPPPEQPQLPAGRLPQLPAPSGEYGASYAGQPVVTPEANTDFTMPFRRGVAQGPYQMPAGEIKPVTEVKVTPESVEQAKNFTPEQPASQPSKAKPVEKPKAQVSGRSSNEADKAANKSQIADYAALRTGTTAQDVAEEFGISVSRAKQILVGLGGDKLQWTEKNGYVARPEFKADVIKRQGKNILDDPEMKTGSTKPDSSTIESGTATKRKELLALRKKTDQTPADARRIHELNTELGEYKKYDKQPVQASKQSDSKAGKETKPAEASQSSQKKEEPKNTKDTEYEIGHDELYRQAEAIGVTPTQLARKLIEQGYTVQRSKFGAGDYAKRGTSKPVLTKEQMTKLNKYLDEKTKKK